MPWSRQNGGRKAADEPLGPWSVGRPTAADLEELLKRSQDREACHAGGSGVPGSLLFLVACVAAIVSF